MTEYKVLITTGGMGSRLGDITKYMNKSLVRIGKKPAISYIVESYPKDIELIITVSHYKEHIQDFLTLVYPERKFTFIDTNSSPSLGCSMLMAKEKLNCPFIFHACDTIVNQPIQEPIYNWIGGHKSTNSSHYRSFTVSNQKVLKMFEKGEKDFDYIYIGLCGIKDYKKFWLILDQLYSKNSDYKELSDCHVISKMLNDYEFTNIKFQDWFDIGNIDGLNIARKSVKETINVVEKYTEDIYMIDDSVIKFFYNDNIVKKRVERSNLLKGLVPKVTGVNGNFYKYKYIDGNVLSENVTVPIFNDLIEWSNKFLWIKSNKANSETFEKFYNFYFTKTRKRMNMFVSENNIQDERKIINGISCPSIMNMVDSIDENLLCNENPCQFHGDFILDNIIYTKDKKFCLIDWRQDFGGTTKYGDIYYDLSKLNHNLIFNHNMINKGYFSINLGNEITLDLFERYNLICCKNSLYSIAEKYGYDKKKISIITSLIWINMAALHTRPLNLFLWYFGQYNLNVALSGGYI